MGMVLRGSDRPVSALSAKTPLQTTTANKSAAIGGVVERPALLFLHRVRTRTLGLASVRHGWDAHEFARVEELPTAERDPLLASLVGDLELTSLVQAIEVATRAFLDELRRGDPALADRLQPPLLAFVEASRSSASSERGT